MMKAIIEDQYTAARAYLLCVVGLVALPSLCRVLPWLYSLKNRGKATHSAITHSYVPTTIYKFLISPTPFGFSLSRIEIIQLLAFIALNLLFGWNRNLYSSDYKLYGWLTLANISLGLLLSPRLSPFSIVLRVPSTSILLYHRFCGQAAVIHATLHFAYTINHDILTFQVDTSLMDTRIRIGIMAWIALCIIGITTLPPVRRRFFELFYYAHFVFLVLIVGALIHASNGPEFILPGLSLWVLDRCLRLYHRVRKVELTDITTYEGSLTKICVKGVTSRMPSQMVWIQFQDIAHLNWHPFTVASAPGDDVVVAVRGLGGWTKKVQYLQTSSSTYPLTDFGSTMSTSMPMTGGMPDKREANTKERPSLPSVKPENALAQHHKSTPTLKIKVNGPYGQGSINWDKKPLILLVAGGVGITPAISIASHIAKLSSSYPSGEGLGYGQHIHLLWTVKQFSHILWFLPELQKLLAIAANTDHVTIEITVHVTGGSSPDLNGVEAGAQTPSNTAIEEAAMGLGAIMKGRPDIGLWFQHIKERRMDMGPGMDAVVNVCGSKGMVTDVRKAAVRYSGRSGWFWLEEEQFER